MGKAGWFFCAGDAAPRRRLKIVAGIAALVNSGFLATDLLIPNLSSWGWFLIILGVLDLSAGYLIMRENQSGCWLGIALSVISIIGWFTFMPSFPGWAAIAILVDVLVMYGLAVHGSELTV